MPVALLKLSWRLCTSGIGGSAPWLGPQVHRGASTHVLQPPPGPPWPSLSVRQPHHSGVALWQKFELLIHSRLHMAEAKCQQSAQHPLCRREWNLSSPRASPHNKPYINDVAMPVALLKLSWRLCTSGIGGSAPWLGPQVHRGASTHVLQPPPGPPWPSLSVRQPHHSGVALWQKFELLIHSRLHMAEAKCQQVPNTHFAEGSGICPAHEPPPTINHILMM